jgi:hypothetical protein
MKPEELLEMCKVQESFGLDRIILTMPTPKSGLSGRRIRTPFGFGEIANEHNGKVCFWIEIKKIRTWLKKVVDKK